MHKALYADGTGNIFFRVFPNRFQATVWLSTLIDRYLDDPIGIAAPQEMPSADGGA